MSEQLSSNFAKESYARHKHDQLSTEISRANVNRLQDDTFTAVNQQSLDKAYLTLDRDTYKEEANKLRDEKTVTQQLDTLNAEAKADAEAAGVHINLSEPKE